MKHKHQMKIFDLRILRKNARIWRRQLSQVLAPYGIQIGEKHLPIIEDHKSHLISTYHFRYRPAKAARSHKAERLVEYCLGDLSQVTKGPEQPDRDYLKETKFFHARFTRGKIIMTGAQRLRGQLTRRYHDHKHIIPAILSQKAQIPEGLCAYICQGDNAARKADFSKGLHLAGMRVSGQAMPALVPTSNRDRFTGPLLAHQMKLMKRDWVDWSEKSDTAWWGGAVTGKRWFGPKHDILSRMAFLDHYASHPDPKVVIHAVEDDQNFLEGRIELKPRFRKYQAFRHKALILLPGNDVASGLTWYFSGNSPVMMSKSGIDHILVFELEPWTHFIPLENDPRDVVTKLDWVLNNADAAQQIVRNAHERLAWFTSPEYIWACNEVLRRLAAHQSGG